MADLICSTDVSNLLRSTNAKGARDAISAASSEVVTVANDTARFALTSAQVSNNTIVYVTADDRYYVVVDVQNLNSNSGYGDIGEPGLDRVIVRNGLSTALSGITLEQGELGYTTDTKRLYVGDGVNVGGNIAGLNSEEGSDIISEYNIADGYGRFVTTFSLSSFTFTLKSSTGCVAVQWWDGVVTIYGVGISANFISCTKAVNQSTNQIYARSALKPVVFWSCTSSTDATKSGNITLLNVTFKNIISLDVSKLTVLTTLICDINQLTSLDVSNNVALTSLTCSNNQLTSLDVSKLTALTELAFYGNQLTSLDLSNNVALLSLNCSSNQLTSLDVSNNIILEYLDCNNNQLTSLDLSNNISLLGLVCNNNQLTSLDLSNNSDLGIVGCTNNQLIYLNLTNVSGFNIDSYYDFSYNPELSNVLADYFSPADVTSLSFVSCNFDTASIYAMVENMGGVAPGSYIDLTDNPYDGGDSALNGLITSKGFTLII